MITFLKKQPKKFFFKKPFKRKVYNNNKILRISSAAVHFDYYGLKAKEPGRLKYRQVDSVRKVFLFFFRFDSDLLIRVNFNSPITKKSIGVRMGRGKGKLNTWVANIKYGQIVFELSKKIKLYKLSVALKIIRERIPIKMKLVYLKIND